MTNDFGNPVTFLLVSLKLLIAQLKMTQSVLPFVAVEENEVWGDTVVIWTNCVSNTTRR